MTPVNKADRLRKIWKKDPPWYYSEIRNEGHREITNLSRVAGDLAKRPNEGTSD
jgi:hypothetical protein